MKSSEFPIYVDIDQGIYLQKPPYIYYTYLTKGLLCFLSWLMLWSSPNSSSWPSNGVSPCFGYDKWPTEKKLVYFITLTKHYNFWTYRKIRGEWKKKKLKRYLINVKKKKIDICKRYMYRRKKQWKKYTEKNPDFLPLLSGRSTIMVMIFRTMPEIVKIT